MIRESQRIEENFDHPRRILPLQPDFLDLILGEFRFYILARLRNRHLDPAPKGKTKKFRSLKNLHFPNQWMKRFFTIHSNLILLKPLGNRCDLTCSQWGGTEPGLEGPVPETGRGFFNSLESLLGSLPPRLKIISGKLSRWPRSRRSAEGVIRRENRPAAIRCRAAATRAKDRQVHRQVQPDAQTL
jgi:hypothetical protein